MRYNFKLVDQVFDFLNDIGVKPHVELGFKDTNFFENISPDVLKLENKNAMSVIEKNKGFLKELIRHFTQRYGVQTVEEWYFELEKNSVIQKKIGIESYLEAFDTLAGIFRTYAPNVKIGGAGFSLNMVEAELSELVERWKKQKQQPDFISIYAYPYIGDQYLLDAGRNPYSPDSNYLYNQIERAKQILREKEYDVPEFMVTEWSSTLSNRNCLNDSCYKGAYVMKNLIQNYGEVDALGYWVATDIFSEGIDSASLLFGGCGLISRDGIRKPVYYAYEHMNQLEKYFLGKSQNAIITSNSRGLFFICCHNYKHFNFRYYSKKENEIKIERQNRFFEDNESIQMSFKIHNVSNGRYQIKIFSVSQENGNVQHEWELLEFFDELSVREIDYLKTTCQPKFIIKKAEASDNVLVVETKLTAQEIQGIVVSEL